MEQLLHNISLADIKDFFLILAAIIGAYVSISTFTGKIKDKRLKPVTDALEEIKAQNKKLSGEIAMLMKIQMAMASDLEAEGEVNGKTQEALDALQEYILNNINK